ncbi:hypothetical protein YN14_003557 [Salmonella enterica subsp. diarizonae]|nr:hypothetical protein [Salmonella enterica subsp. diarizonae]
MHEEFTEEFKSAIKTENLLHKLKAIITAANSLELPEEKNLQSELMDLAQQLLIQACGGTEQEAGK